MKKKLFIFIIVGILLMPFGVNAGTKTVLGKDYETKTFVEALEEEEIEKQFSNYQESPDKITIYLFRGRGCGFCQAYLTFMDSITEEYGKYFNMVTFEVWNNEDNWYLMQKISYYLDEEIAGGVPYVIIGDQVFPGYASVYDEEIKSAIVDLYNTEKNKRYDVFEAVEKDGLISDEELQKLYEAEEYDDTGSDENYSTTSSTKSNTSAIVLWDLLFVAAGTIAVIIFNNYKFNKLSEDFKDLKKEINKKEKKKNKES